MRHKAFVLFAFFFLLFPLSAIAQITIDTSNASDWKIGNGVISLDWSSTGGNVYGIYLAGHTDNLIDITNTHNGLPKGFYMDNAGPGSGTATPGYYLDVNGEYIDWWITVNSSSSNAFTYSEHFVLVKGKPDIHVYFVANHSATDISGSLGQIQWVCRLNLPLFTNTYAVDKGIYDPGPEDVTLPDPSVEFPTDPARTVQDATVDLHGLPLPAGFTRQFYTKYDYSSYEYFHKAHGVYGSTYAAWTVLPSKESFAGGPTKQDLIFTNNLLMIEALSGHLDNSITYKPANGVDASRLFGPYIVHFNTFDQTHTTPASLYREALFSSLGADAFYDHETILIENGYVPSWQRSLVTTWNRTAPSFGQQKAFTVLSDNQINFQYSALGRQYWVENDLLGLGFMPRVTPGTYRLSTYVLGQWGELRRDNVIVPEHDIPIFGDLKFTPENFGTEPPIWTIGTPDRSAHEFLHGHRADGHVDRQYWGNWNYWADFAANQGAVVYYATPVGSTPATNNLDQWNYNQWLVFNPNLFGGFYNPADDTKDGYSYIRPAYVTSPTQQVPPWQIHFTTTADQQQQGQYVALSVGLAANEASLTFTLNGQPLIWHGSKIKPSDAAVRSGVSGTYQWVVFQWDASALNPPGEDNVITLGVSSTQGTMYDALRMEITNKSADPAVTGWHDYEFLYGAVYTPANDAVPNQ